MNEVRLRLAASAASKERRLAALVAAGASERALLDAARRAQAEGSAALSGLPPGEETALLRAVGAVSPAAPLSADALHAWHLAVTGSGGLRTSEAERPGATPPSPPEFIAGRLAILEQWMNAPSAAELAPSQQGALALARVVEVRPFQDGNGRVSRLAASHVMVKAGARPPILAAADGPRLLHAIQAAFQLHTEPLAALLEEASERALDLMIREAERA